MTCPRCGCPAYRVHAHQQTFNERGQLTESVLCRIAECCNCKLELHRLPGEGVVSTYPKGPFKDQEDSGPVIDMGPPGNPPGGSPNSWDYEVQHL